MRSEALEAKRPDRRGKRTGPFIAAAVAAALLPAGAAVSQEMRSGSELAGISWPVSSYDWADKPGGPRQTVLEAAAVVAGGECGVSREFNAWNLAGEDEPEQFRDRVLSTYSDAGWTLSNPNTAQPHVFVATRGFDTLAVWLDLDNDRHALSLFTCLIGGNEASPATSANARERGTIPVVGELGLGVLAIAGGLLFVGLRQRRLAAVAKTWEEVSATIEASSVETRTETDADGDETEWHTPKVSYRYTIGGQEYRGERLRFGTTKTTNAKRAKEVIAGYPPGAVVSARVNPKKPNEATLEAAGPRMGAFLPVAVVFGLVGAILLVAKSAM